MATRLPRCRRTGPAGRRAGLSFWDGWRVLGATRTHPDERSLPLRTRPVARTRAILVPSESPGAEGVWWPLRSSKPSSGALVAPGVGSIPTRSRHRRPGHGLLRRVLPYNAVAGSLPHAPARSRHRRDRPIPRFRPSLKRILIHGWRNRCLYGERFGAWGPSVRR